MRILTLTLILSIFALPIFAETAEDVYKDLRVGMTKAELYKIYPESYKRRHKENVNGEEWITFDDYKATKPGYWIIFHLRNGKVDWWNKEELPEDPEGKLKSVLERKQRSPQQPDLATNPKAQMEKIVKEKQAARAERFK